ncbi:MULTISPECIES: MATE family efflux transporter [unclassified Clostridium]|uniref:MATE family efflux transporter n=1 Tax=unclassified Clostridium TaxID=2614128 RepID=UPI001105CC3D|nr:MULTISPECIES: MATE family efflux transporter [unclassified Clostridium]
MQDTSCLKEFTKYTALNVLGMIGLSCYILADTFFIAKGLGTSGLAALNLAIPIYSFIHGSGLMFGIGGATKFSISRKSGLSDQIFTNTLFFAGILAVLFFLAGLFLSTQITVLLGADGEVAEMTQTYLKMILLFAPAFMLGDILVCFVRNDGNPKLSMLAMLGGSMANILLDYVFIFPLGMGIFGAVLATGLAPLISIAIMSGHWMKKNKGFHLAKTAIQGRMALLILSLGFPSLITEVSSGIVIIVFNIIILGLKGNVGVAAYGVIANLSLVVISIFTGIAQGIQPLISSAYGCGDSARSRVMLRYGLTTAAVVSLTLYAVICYGAAPITAVFNSEQNHQLQVIAEYGLRLYFTGILAAGVNIILSIFFTSTEQAVPAHIISLLRGLVLIIPMAFVLSSLWGMTGVWLAFPVTELVSALLGVGIHRHSCS